MAGNMWTYDTISKRGKKVEKKVDRTSYPRAVWVFFWSSESKSTAKLCYVDFLRRVTYNIWKLTDPTS